MGELQKWLDQKWVRIDSSGNIKGECGTSKDKKNPDRCLPSSKAKSLSKSQRASTARKKKREGKKGKTVVSNTRSAKVTKMARGGVAVSATKAKRPFRGKSVPGTAVARGCGAVMPNRRKRTKGSVTQG
tara:strand:+ start:249 stop:635 length:387 start_codon:yes stop_codon:yes gene_type:complete